MVSKDIEKQWTQNCATFTELRRTKTTSEGGGGGGVACIDTAKKRVESILDFQLIYHLHSGTKCFTFVVQNDHKY